MLGQLKRLGADSLLYAFMNVGTKLIAFLLFPFYTFYLTDTAEFGMLDMADRTIGMVTFLVIFGTDSALAYYYYEVEDKVKRNKYIRSVMTFRLAVVALIFLVLLIGGKWISEWVFDDAGSIHLLYIAMFTLLFDTVIALVLTVARYQMLTKKVVFMTLLKMLLIALVSMAVLAYVWTTVEGILFARMASVIFIFLLLFWSSKEMLKPFYDRVIWKELLIYSAPLVPASLAFWVILNSNSFILKHYYSMDVVGIYGTAIKFATFITLLTSGIQMAWRPFSMSLYKKENSANVFASVYGLILMAGSYGILLLATIMPWVIKILSDNYEEAYPYVAPIAIATFLNFYYLIISIGIFVTKQTKHVSIAFAISAGLTILLSFLLIPNFGIWGAVYSYIAAYCLATFLIYRKSQKLFYVPFPGWKMAFVIFTLIASTFAIIGIQLNGLGSSLIFVVWVVFTISLLLVRIDKHIQRGKRGD
ncbi:lipopolysaccharide biosynthesis protein [Paenisporosarcina sp. NPDC076898]|uniref:lipopolysaccharide biosynthesis protein n=1 Tax=unclassified Paenisporosarcina TaxID=2642018 RepID=UPI003CFD53DA